MPFRVDTNLESLLETVVTHHTVTEENQTVVLDVFRKAAIRLEVFDYNVLLVDESVTTELEVIDFFGTMPPEHALASATVPVDQLYAYESIFRDTPTFEEYTVFCRIKVNIIQYLLTVICELFTSYPVLPTFKKPLLLTLDQFRDVPSFVKKYMPSEWVRDEQLIEDINVWCQGSQATERGKYGSFLMVMKPTAEWILNARRPESASMIGR
jgi:hypothetical protein